MSPELERQIMNTVIMYSKRDQWRKWGMHTLRKQGAAVLIEGPPGTGKTVIAEYLALQVRKKGLKELSFADFGSQVPGENSRQIRGFFEAAKKNGNMTVVLDECEAVLWDRAKAEASAMWMLEVIDELLVQIGKYAGFIILISNKPELLDPALFRRLIAVIRVEAPQYPERIRLWKSKFPMAYPIHPSAAYLKTLATLQLTGAEIENVLIEYTSDCIRTDSKPDFDELLAVGVRYLEGKEQQEERRAQSH